MVLNKDTYSNELITKLAAFYSNESIDKNRNQSIQITKRLWLNYHSEDREYLNKLIKLHECLNDELNNTELRISSKWIQPYAVLADQRNGKSVFNTDMVKSYNQHFADTPYKCTQVPLEKGFVSHHRDVPLIDSGVAFKNVIIDLENYHFQKDIS